MIKIKLPKYNRFVEIRLMRYADKGIMTALAKAKPLVTHCPVAKDTFTKCIKSYVRKEVTRRFESCYSRHDLKP